VSLFSQFEGLEPDDAKPDRTRPLAERMRPRTLEEFAGQEELLGPGTPLRTQIERDELSSMLLWGPPGCGKTTLARLIARRTRAEFVPFSAVLSGIKEIKQVMDAAQRTRQYGRRTIVFVDEVHRFNKAQQDAFLPHVESGAILLIGATTENPSFEVISPLLSRLKVYVLRGLRVDEITGLLHRALADPDRGYGGQHIDVAPELLERIALLANGDARAAYNTLEAIVLGTAPDERGIRSLTPARLEEVLQHRLLPYDKAGEEHFNLISALHKSVRNSDADAALYWLVRMLESGEDPLYLARRLVRMASEDIGLADPHALPLAMAAMQAYDFIGAPEGYLALAETAVYLSLAPKSDAVYAAYNEVSAELKRSPAEPVPMQIRNAVTGLMKKVGYGAGYQHAHNYEEKVTGMECLPESLRGKSFYRPGGEGFEEQARERLEEIQRLRERLRQADRAISSRKPS
jgi:putative ATPase